MLKGVHVMYAHVSINVMTSGIVVWETGIKTKDNVSENI